MSDKKLHDGSLLKIVATRVQSTGTIENLYECFTKHRQYMLDNKIASMFVDRIGFFMQKSVSNYDKEKCQELLLDIETDRSMHYSSVVSAMGEPTVTVEFKVKNGSVYHSCLSSLIMMAIDRVGYQKAAVSSFLGIPVELLSDLLYENQELKLYWNEAKRKSKRFEE
jgi:hypothetical protein